MSFDLLFAALDKYAVAVTDERLATEHLDKLRVERDAAEGAARAAAIACDEARNLVWSQVEAIAGKRSELWKIMELNKWNADEQRKDVERFRREHV